MDVGTATKILLLDKDGFFSSGIIMPGVEISANTLFEKGEQLPSINLELPRKVVARNTFESMNVGILIGHVEGISGIIKRLEEELGYETKHVLTGGMAKNLLDAFKIDMIYDENLILEGLLAIYYKNRG